MELGDAPPVSGTLSENNCPFAAANGIHGAQDMLKMLMIAAQVTMRLSLMVSPKPKPIYAVAIIKKTKSQENVMGANTLTITDNRTGKQYEIPIEHGTIKAMDLRQIKTSDEDFGLMTYDPAFTNTASCKSNITLIDGDVGILRYRGYPIEQLAEQSTYLEVAYLILHGELPNQTQLKDWVWNITHHTFIHENIKKCIDGYHYDAHPMGMFIGTVGALSTFYPDAKNIFNEDSRCKQVYRLIAKVATIAAFAYRHRMGLPYSYPDNDLSFTGNFLNMMFKKTELKYQPNPVLEKALEVLFILHADHEQNCSTNAMRSIGSSEADPYSALAGAAAALYGPLHGGANESVLKMLNEIGTVEKVPEYIKRVKAGEFRLMGFGHRVYKNYDPRARIIKQVAYEVFEVTGKDKLLDVALELERIALEDDYFVSRKLYPNVDFYSGIIYQAMGFPVDIFPVLFAIPRTSGWIAQWQEMLLDPEQKIARPRQIYLGSDERDYLPLDKRG
jgi:citrate synthase